MKHSLSLHAGLLAALLSLAANQLYAGSVIDPMDEYARDRNGLTSPLKFSVIDPMDDYARDRSGFAPLGAFVTQEMREAAKRAAAKFGG